MPKPEDMKPETSDAELDRLLARRFASLHRSLDNDSNSGVFAVYLRYKGGGFWQGVIKRIRSDGGGQEVIFGRGGSISKTIKDLNAAVANGAWREDKPWRPD